MSAVRKIKTTSTKGCRSLTGREQDEGISLVGDLVSIGVGS